jgi:hypothetical protein
MWNQKRRVLSVLAAVVVAVGLVLPDPAIAGVGEPMPATIPDAPPPIPDLPDANPLPPAASLIADPVTPEATCGSWVVQSSYAGLWPTNQTWWEFQCTYAWVPCSGICNADWSGSRLTRDHFIYDGGAAVLVGEMTLDTYADSVQSGDFCTYWWDVPTGSWYRAETTPCHQAPVPQIAASCSGLTCTFDAHVVIDADWPIEVYLWAFGDGGIGNEANVSHTFASTGAYQVTLDVWDEGLWAWTSSTVQVVGPAPTPTPTPTPTPSPTPTPTPTPVVINLSLDSVRAKGIVTVSLTWSGAPGSVDVLRDGTRIATTAAGSYVDVMSRPPKGTRIYRVCVAGTSTCSAAVSVTV